MPNALPVFAGNALVQKAKVYETIAVIVWRWVEIKPTVSFRGAG